MSRLVTSQRALIRGVCVSVVVETKEVKGAALQGLYFDLEEIEKGQKSYPLSISFIQLLLTLVYATKPPALGACSIASCRFIPHACACHCVCLSGEGHRRPGIGPYIDFVRKHVSSCPGFFAMLTC